MRRNWLYAIALAGLMNNATWAQMPPTNPAAGQANPPGQPGAAQRPALPPEHVKVLNEIMGAWETDAKALQSLYVQFEETTLDNVFKKPIRLYGEAKILKMAAPGQFGLRLEMYRVQPDGKPDYSRLERKYICSGNWMYDFNPESKIIFFRRLENQNIKPDDGPFAFIFGMNAVDLQRRFALEIAQQDKDWTWFRVTPQTAQDQKEFKVAIIGMINYASQLAPKYFPVQIKWQEPTQNERSWTFKQVIRNDPAKVSVIDFTVEEDKKRGWVLKEVPSQLSMSQQLPPVVPPGGGTPRK